MSDELIYPWWFIRVQISSSCGKSFNTIFSFFYTMSLSYLIFSELTAIRFNNLILKKFTSSWIHIHLFVDLFGPYDTDLISVI